MAQFMRIQYDKASMEAVRKALKDIPGAYDKVFPRAINKVAIRERTAVVRNLAKIINLKQKDIRDRNVILRKANKRKWVARLSISGARIPLSRFGAKQLKRAGVRYKIRKSGGFVKLAHSFLATLSSGHKGVFLRVGDSRLPITEKFGPSVPQITRDSRLVNPVLINIQLRKEIDNQVSVLTERALAKKAG